MRCLLAALALLATAASAQKPPTAAAQEQLEQKLVAHLRRLAERRAAGDLAPLAPKAAKKEGDELLELLRSLAGLSKKDLGTAEAAKLAQVLPDVLGRRGPLLLQVHQLEARVNSCRALQAQVPLNLKALQANQARWRATQKPPAYATHMADVGRVPDTSGYAWELTNEGADHFRIRAVGLGDLAGDTWDITETGPATHDEDRCASLAQQERQVAADALMATP